MTKSELRVTAFVGFVWIVLIVLFVVFGLVPFVQALVE